MSCRRLIGKSTKEERRTHYLANTRLLGNRLTEQLYWMTPHILAFPSTRTFPTSPNRWLDACQERCGRLIEQKACLIRIGYASMPSLTTLTINYLTTALPRIFLTHPFLSLFCTRQSPASAQVLRCLTLYPNSTNCVATLSQNDILRRRGLGRLQHKTCHGLYIVLPGQVRHRSSYMQTNMTV
jgi:hypothetical protein